jgi:hypothetical protein
LVSYLVSDEKLIAGLHEEAVAYLEKKTQAIKEMGVEKVSYIAEYGVAADEIIALGKKRKKNAGQSDRHVHARQVRYQTLGLRQRNGNRGAAFRRSPVSDPCDGLNYTAAATSDELTR